MLRKRICVFRGQSQSRLTTYTITCKKMIISERKKFIFIHIKKNAGSSIAKALLPEISGPLTILMDHVFRRIGRPIGFGPKRYPSHITAQELVNEIGEELFSQFFSFAVVRNPWDWQSSLYNYALKLPSHNLHSKVKELGSFDAYLKWHCQNIENQQVPAGMGVVTQSEFIFADDGRQLVEYVARFENLENDFHKVCERIGVSAELPRVNVHKVKPYRNFYNEERRNLVAEYFNKDVENFGYDF